jgi:hypothetical protein
MRAALVFSILLLSTSAAWPAEKARVFDFEGAVERGLKKQRAGLLLEEVLKTLGNTTTGFSVVVHTPETWVHALAYDAAEKGRPFSIASLTDDDKGPFLRVIALPDAPRKVTKTSPASSVVNVRVRSLKKTEVVEPVRLEAFDASVVDAAGNKKPLQGARAVFRLDDVERVAALDPDGEFHVSIDGDGSDKDFRVKRGHFDLLGWGVARIQVGTPVAVVESLLGEPSSRTTAPRAAVGESDPVERIVYVYPQRRITFANGRVEKLE